MFKFLAHIFRRGAPGKVAGSTLILMAFMMQADAASLPTPPQMQQLADNAALTGVTALGTSEAQSDADRRIVAVAAAKKMIPAIEGVTGEVTASVETMTVTVKLASKTLAVASNARYVPPDQPTNWVWASRQHFAIGHDPVVVGSTCAQDCGHNRLR